MQCREGCAACCIALSISEAMPGLPDGKPAGMACPHLDEALKCSLFGRPERPRTCIGFQAEREFCGDNREQALEILNQLEEETHVDRV